MLLVYTVISDEARRVREMYRCGDEDKFWNSGQWWNEAKCGPLSERRDAAPLSSRKLPFIP